MINSAKVVPEIYNTSLDFKIFEAILDCIYSEADLMCANLKGLHSPRQCFSENLEKLSKLTNIKTTNRQLMKVYNLMLKSKGTLEAVEAAMLYSGVELTKLESIPENGLSIYRRFVRPRKNQNNEYLGVTIYYEGKFTSNFNSELFQKLRSTLIPFNCQLQILPKNLIDLYFPHYGEYLL